MTFSPDRGRPAMWRFEPAQIPRVTIRLRWARSAVHRSHLHHRRLGRTCPAAGPIASSRALPVMSDAAISAAPDRTVLDFADELNPRPNPGARPPKSVGSGGDETCA